MSKHQARAPGKRVPSEGHDRGLALVTLLIASALIIFLFVGIGDQEVRPERDSLVTVQQPSGLDKLRNAVGLEGSLPPPRGDTPGRRLGEGLRLAPRALEGEVGYVITNETDAEVFAKARFRPGDVLMTMDGRPLDPARIDGLGDELSLLDAVEVSFLRDGQMRKRVIDLLADRRPGGTPSVSNFGGHFPKFPTLPDSTPVPNNA